MDSLPKDGGWLYELKYDGYRMLAFIEGGTVRLITRNGKDYTGHFKSAAESLRAFYGQRAVILDGEMTVTDSEGHTDFQALQNYMKSSTGRNITYFIFDLLALDGEDLRGKPLIERKKQLEALMAGAPSTLHYSRHVEGQGRESLAAACEAGMEGIVGKRADSPYSGTRNNDWVKLKCGKRQEFVICGYTRTEKKADSGISAFILGVYKDGELIYAGRAGTGLSLREMAEMESKFKSFLRSTPPCKGLPRPKANERYFWLEAKFAGEVRFAEWTDEGQLRQATFIGLREDKNIKEIVREECAGESGEAENEEQLIAKSDVMKKLKITNPGKVIFEDPAVTKGEVIEYYQKVAARMLPYVKNRILSIVRCPKGVNEACFYKKHPGPESKGIVTMPVTASAGNVETYFYIENELGLLNEAQMGTLEFHTWGSTADNIEHPDIMVFDLDPDEGMEISRVRQGVWDIKSILDRLNLVSFLKTSGGKGYHVVVPFAPAPSWDAFHDFSRRVAEVMEQKWPDRYTANVRKNARGGKIFIDWIRNARSATSIAPYSLRARKGAKVSMPITWEELDKVAPNGIGMAEALERISGMDPWKDFFTLKQELK